VLSIAACSSSDAAPPGAPGAEPQASFADGVATISDDVPIIPWYAMPMRRPDGSLAARHASSFSGHGDPQAPLPIAPNNKLKYYGGPVIANVKVYQVNWGPNVDATLKMGMPGYYTAITNSTYFDWLNEYDTAGKTAQDGQAGTSQHIGRGTFGGTYTITPSNTATSLTNAQIGAELASQITAMHLPQPDLAPDGNVNAIYMIDFPPGISINLDGQRSCVQFCAYHYTQSINGKSVPYGVHPDMSAGSPCANGCGGSSNAFNNATSVHSHELVEAVTDPAIGLVTGNLARPAGWTSTGGEIGDLCNAQQATVAGYTVQKEWSNAQGACVVQGPNGPTPVCDGSTQPPNCRNCVPADCTGAKPYCATSGSKAGQCVACTSNTNCSGGTPICDSNADTCRACTSADCPNGACVTTANDPAHGQCVTCTSANHGACTGATPKCNDATHTCVACLADADCTDPAKPKCDTGSHTCVAGPSMPDAGMGGHDSGAGDSGANDSGSSGEDSGSTGMVDSGHGGGGDSGSGDHDSGGGNGGGDDAGNGNGGGNGDNGGGNGNVGQDGGCSAAPAGDTRHGLFAFALLAAAIGAARARRKR
jgi:hypothetical protein